MKITKDHQYGSHNHYIFDFQNTIIRAVIQIQRHSQNGKNTTKRI
jgi:hypothetical protein